MMNPRSPAGRVIRSLILIVFLLAVGSGAAAMLWAIRVVPPRHDVPSLPPVVETLSVRAEDVVERYVGYGTSRAIRSAGVAAEVSAQVVERVGDIRAGTRVAASQVMLRLDPRQYELTAERAKALAVAEQAVLDELAADERSLAELTRTAQTEIEVAQRERERVTKLFEHDMAAKKEYDFANLAYRQAQRVLQEYEMQTAKFPARRARSEAARRGFEQDAAIAQLNIERCTIAAPFDGAIVEVRVDVGDHVTAGAVVLTLVDDSRVEIPIQLPSGDYDHALVGAACRVAVENEPDARWEGAVARVDPGADPNTRTFAVYIEVDNAGQTRRLVPGMFVRAEVQGPSHPGRFLVPREACRDNRVYVVQDGTARTRSVTAEGFLEDRAIVTGDLRTGDLVILSHLDQMADGLPVRVHAPRSAAAESSPAPQAQVPGASP